MRIEGRARVFGDGINTDYIISSARKRVTLDPDELKRWLFETVDPGFAASIQEDDILVAGEAFGSGSAMEVAVTAVRAAGIRAVVAKSFSRTYFRNAINNGLLPVECATSGVSEGDLLRIEVDHARALVVNTTTGLRYEAPPFADFVYGVLEAGGLVDYLRDRGRLV